VITPVVQRWRERRSSYRWVGEAFDPRGADVEPIDDDTTPKRFVVEHHYAASYPAARFRFGLYRRGALEGVAVFSVPQNAKTLACLPGVPEESVELGRLVLLDRVEANAETWFLARCFERLRAEGLVGVVSFSDPVARTTARGKVVFPGHVGTIYQSHNGVYLGRSKPGKLRLFADGTTLSPRAIAKLRNGERGQNNVVRKLVLHGADRPLWFTDLREWATYWARELTREVPHAGNIKYAWTLRARDRRHLRRFVDERKRELEERGVARDEIERRFRYPKFAASLDALAGRAA
jgi:hypothetical protein